MFSRFWLSGRRGTSPRSRDEYVDRYRPGEWLLVIGVFVLSLADLLLTFFYLEQGGEEANPFMRFVLLRGGYIWFSAVKMAVTLGGLLFVLVHIRFGRVRLFLQVLLGLNVALLGYHLYLQWALA